MTTTLQDQLAQLRDLADGSDAEAVYDAAAEIITALQAELECYRDGEAPAAPEVEQALADVLRALAGCVRYIEGRGETPPCLYEARAMLEEAQTPPFGSSVTETT